MEKRFSYMGGISVGDSIIYNNHFSWPFARLTMQKDKITLRYFLFFRIDFKKSEINFLKGFANPLFPKVINSVIISHHKKKEYSFVSFSPSFPKSLLKDAKSMGYKVINK